MRVKQIILNENMPILTPNGHSETTSNVRESDVRRLYMIHGHGVLVVVKGQADQQLIPLGSIRNARLCLSEAELKAWTDG